MIDVILRLGHAVPEWFAAHPAAGAIIYGWLFGVVVTQGAKRFYPLAWIESPDSVKRASQLIATASAGLFAFSVWPVESPLRWQFALLCGMACPQVYTALKWLLPNIAARWGWAQMAWSRATK